MDGAYSLGILEHGLRGFVGGKQRQAGMQAVCRDPGGRKTHVYKGQLSWREHSPCTSYPLYVSLFNDLDPHYFIEAQRS